MTGGSFFGKNLILLLPVFPELPKIPVDPGPAAAGGEGGGTAGPDPAPGPGPKAGDRLTLRSDILQRHDSHADQEGAHHHSRECGGPFPALVESVEVVPAFAFRRVDGPVQVPGAVEHNGQHAPKRLGEGHAALFEDAEGGQRQQRRDQVHKQIRPLQQHEPVPADARRQEQEYRRHGDRNPRRADILEHPDPFRHRADGGSRRRQQRRGGAQHVAQAGKEPEGLPGPFRRPSAVLAEKASHQHQGQQEDGRIENHVCHAGFLRNSSVF